jgi:hypothetical protein
MMTQARGKPTNMTIRPPGVGMSVAERQYTTPIACSVDGQAHDVTDETAAVGHHAGKYQALCGYVVLAASMIAPVGRPCSKCIAASVMAQRTMGQPVRRSRHRQTGRLWRMLRQRLAVPS